MAILKSDDIINKRYRIDRLIGEGGMGQVYLVEDLLNPKADLMALKLFNLEKEKAELFLAWFKDEFHTLSTLKHPGLAAVYDYGRDQKTQKPFYTCEFISGQDLFRASRKMPLQKIITLLAKITMAIDFIHTKGVLHNDLKTSNILVEEPSGHPKVLDFGLSRKLKGAEKSKQKPSLIGTPSYLAPEVIQDEPPSFQSDLFALGMVFYRVLAGRLPFEETLSKEILYAQVHKNFPKPRKWNRDLPKELEDLILSLIQKDPGKRPQSAQEVFARLSLMGEESLRTSVDLNLLSYAESHRLMGREQTIRKVHQFVHARIPEGRDSATPQTLGSGDWSLTDLVKPDFETPGLLKSVAFIAGETGLGKSKLLQAEKNHFQLQDVPFVLIDCLSNPSVFAPWRFALQQIAGFLKPSSRILKKYKGFLASLETDADVLDSEGLGIDTTAFFVQSGQFLFDVFGVTPFILAFDNLDRGDDPTRAFLAYLTRMQDHHREKRLPPILATCQHSQSLGDLFSGARHLLLTLELLTPAQCLEILEDFFPGQEMNEAFAERVYKKSSGNPQYIQEILRDLIASKVLRRDRGVWNFDDIKLDQIDISQSLQDLVAKRVGALPKVQRNILATVAIWRGSIQMVDLESLTSLKPDVLQGHIEGLCRQEFLRREGVNVEFSQAVCRDIVLTEIAGDLEQKHLNCARYLETKRSKPLHLLAWHYAKANQPDRASDFALKAVEKERRFWSQDEALGLYELAYAQASKAGIVAREVRALSGLGEILWRQGKRQKASEAYEEVLNRSGEAKEAKNYAVERAAAWRGLGIRQRDLGAYEKAIENFRNALSDLGRKEKTTQAEIAAQIALAYKGLGKKKEIAQWSDRAEDLIKEPKGYSKTGAPVLIILGYLFWQSGSPVKAKDYFQNALTISIQTHDVRRKAVILLNLGSLAAQQGHWVEAAKVFEESVQISRDLGDAIGTCNSLLHLGNVEYIFGAYQKAAERFQESFDLAISIDNQNFLASLHLSLGLLETDRGNLHLAKTHLDAAKTMQAQLRDKNNLFYVYQALTHLFLNLRLFDIAQKYIREILQKCKNPEILFSSQLNRLNIAIQTDDREAALENLEKAKGSVAPETNIDLRLLLTLREAEMALQLAKPEKAQVCLEGFSNSLPRVHNRVNREFYQLLLLQTRVDICRREKVEKKFRGVIKDLRMFLKKIHWNENSDLKWKSELLLAESLEEAGEISEAFDGYRRIQEFLFFQADNLDPQWRKRFLEDPEKKKVALALERLSQTSDLASKELRESRHQNEKYQRLLEINRQLTACWRNRQSLLDYILDTALDLVGARRGFIVLREQNSLAVVISRNRSNDKKWDAENEFSRTIMEDVLAKGQPRVFLDAASEPILSASRSVQGLGLKSVVCVPLRLGAQVLGVLYLDHDEKVGLFPKSDVDLLLAMADQATLVLQLSETFAHLEGHVERTTQKFSQAQSIIYQQGKALEWKYSYAQMIGGKDPAMRRVFALLDRVTQSNISVLIQGESGTGKELVAQAIHYNGPRKPENFVAINCSGLNPNLLQSELFGHVKGAFTGADRNKVGLFLQADKGTLFLDEIADMPLEVQANLLRAIQEKEIQPLGSEETVKIDVRVLAASNKPLSQLVRSGTFREDLYYRLNVVLIEMPSLRERPADFDLLIDAFLRQFSERRGGREQTLSERARRMLHSYPWPGNVRELKHTLESMTTLCPRKRIEVSDLPPHIYSKEKQPLEALPKMEEALEEFYRGYFHRLLDQFSGHISKAAKFAGVHRGTFTRLMKKYRIKV